MGESLTPIQKIAIIWACPPFHLGVIPNGGLAVRPQFCALFGSKDPMAFLFRSPVVLDKPFLSSGGMFAPGPLHELEIQDMVTPGERSGRADCSIVVGPPTNDWIEFLDKSLLGDTSQFPQSLVQFVDMTFDGFFAWSDDGFEPKCSSMRVCSGVGFSHGKLPDGEPKKVKAHVSIEGCECVRHFGFTWLQFQSPIF